MKKHFLERVDIEECLVQLDGEDETTLGGCCAYEGGAIFGSSGLFEGSEANSGGDVMKQDRAGSS